jgi:hypothetical protein
MDSAVTIGVWQNDIVVARGHPAPERVRGDIETMTAHVADALAEGLAEYAERKAGEVILVRRLVIDCDVDTRCDHRHAARVLAYRCAAALVQAIESGSAEVVRFASAAAFLARFLEDLACGRACGQWYYRRFEGLRNLASSAAIRSALLDDAATGRSALAAIDPSAWPALARTLHRNDAIRILEGLVDDDEGALDAASKTRVAAAVLADDFARVAAPPSVLALVLFARAVREGARASLATAHAARMLAAIASLLDARSYRAAEALALGDVVRLARVDAALATALAAALASADGTALRALARTVLDAHNASASTFARAVDATLPCPFAGLVLLLDEIDVLLDPELVLALPPLDGASPRGAAALAIIALAAGRGQSSLVWNDAAWREIFGVTDACFSHEFAAALTATTPDAAVRAQSAIAATAARHVRGDVIATAFRARGARLRIDVDTSTGLWCRVASEGEAAGSSENVRFRERLSAARKARADWLTLDIDPAHALPLDWLKVFVSCAQIAWRRLAQRVPGMSGASLAYLRANLVGAAGEVTRVAPQRWHWRIQRPPLHVLLTLAGLARSERCWPGPPEQHIEWEMV